MKSTCRWSCPCSARWRRTSPITWCTRARITTCSSQRATAASSVRPTWMRDVLIQRAEVSQQVVAWPTLHEQMKQLTEWMRTCKGPGLPVEDLIPAAQLLVADLRPAELDAVWDSVESACGGTVSPRARAWLDYFRAVSHRDGAGMAARARRLLD